MTPTTAFKKGDKVYLVRSWDGKAISHWRALTVHSCGKQRMLLVTDDGQKFEGNAFYHRNQHITGVQTVFIRSEISDIAAFALNHAKEYKAARITRMESQITESDFKPYTDNMTKDLNELKSMEPQGREYEVLHKELIEKMREEGKIS